MGSKADTREPGAARDPLIRGSPGSLAALGTAGSQVPVPAALTTPHLTLLEPLPPPLPEPPQQPPSEPFPTLPPQPPPRVSADSAASQAEHVTSDQESTAFRAQASGGLAGTDGLPEVVGGAWARPARLELGWWGPGCRFPREMSSRLRTLSLLHQTRGWRCTFGDLQPAPSLAGRPPTTEVLYCSRALSGEPPPAGLGFPNSWFWPQAAARLVGAWKTERNRQDTRSCTPSSVYRLLTVDQVLWGV